MYFSVIIPVYNRRNFICRAVESVLSQTFRDYELIVVDDGSDDGTSAELEKYKPVKVIYKSNGGVSSARNCGITAASGKYIALLDSDDEWLPEKLMRQKSFADANPDIRVFQCDEMWIRRNVRVNPKLVHSKSSGDFFTRSLSMCLVSPSASVIRKDVFCEYGLFDEALPVCEDYDFWLRVLSRESIGYMDEILIRKHGGLHEQLSASRWGMDRFRVYSMIKLLRSDVLKSALSRDAVISEIEKKLKILAGGADKRGNLDFSARLKDLSDSVKDSGSTNKDCSFLLQG